MGRWRGRSRRTKRGPDGGGRGPHETARSSKGGIDGYRRATRARTDPAGRDHRLRAPRRHRRQEAGAAGRVRRDRGRPDPRPVDPGQLLPRRIGGDLQQGHRRGVHRAERARAGAAPLRHRNRLRLPAPEGAQGQAVRRVGGGHHPAVRARARRRPADPLRGGAEHRRADVRAVHRAHVVDHRVADPWPDPDRVRTQPGAAGRPGDHLGGARRRRRMDRFSPS